MDFASDLEMLASALSSGLQPVECLELLSVRASESWRAAFSEVSHNYEKIGNFAVALTQAKKNIGDYRCDSLFELLIANHQLGGQGLVKLVLESAEHARIRATSNEDSLSRIRSVMSITRLGLLSPWIMLGLLCTRADNFATYLSPSGISVIAIGVVATLAAWLISKSIAQMPKQTRALCR